MGYRLGVHDKDGNLYFYGTKHYGYSGDTYEDLIRFPSFRYLADIGKVREDEFILFDYGCDNTMELTAEEFAKFIELYSKEWDDIRKNEYPHAVTLDLLGEPGIQEALKDPRSKTIDWS